MGLFYYRIYGLIIGSDIELDGVERVESSNALDCIIQRKEMNSDFSNEIDVEERMGKGYLITYSKDWACIRFVHQGIFVVVEGKEINYELKEGYDPVYINSVIVSTVINIALMQQGRIVLHGSAICLNDKVIALCGESGSGKSTLTSEFIEQGVQFMADDSIALSFEKNKVYAQSAYARRKLCRDAAIKYGYNPNELIKVASEEKDKFFVTVEKQFVKDPKVLAAIVVITENDAEKVTLKEVLGANKIRFVLDNLFKRNDFGANKLDQKEFKNCLEIVKKIPIYQLERPRNKMTVKEQVNVIKETV